MERNDRIPGAQPPAGAGTGGQDVGLGATRPGAASPGAASAGAGRPAGHEDASVRERGADLVDRGREKIEDAVDSGRDRAAHAVDRGRDRAEHVLDSGKARLADGIGAIGERLDEQATRLEEHGGLGSRAGRYVQRASDVAEDSAEYLRTHDLDVIRDDFVEQIRARPLLSCGIALGAGFLLGSAGSSGSGQDERHHDDDDDDRYAARPRSRGRSRSRAREMDHDDDESGMRAQLGRAVVAGVTTLLTREIRSRVSGRDR